VVRVVATVCNGTVKYGNLWSFTLVRCCYMKKCGIVDAKSNYFYKLACGACARLWRSTFRDSSATRSRGTVGVR
jgi:hypothetical protein